MKTKVLSICGKAKEKAIQFGSFVKKNTLALVASAAAILPSTAVMETFATKINTNVDEDGLMGGVLDIIFKIFRYIGILLLVWSIGMLVLAFKNEDADSKSRAMMMMVVSVVLVGIEAVVRLTGLIS